MVNFILGVIVGLLFSLLAVITGKKLEKVVNDPRYTVSHIKNTFVQPKAQIIKKEDDITDFLNNQ